MLVALPQLTRLSLSWCPHLSCIPVHPPTSLKVLDVSHCDFAWDQSGAMDVWLQPHEGAAATRDAQLQLEEVVAANAKFGTSACQAFGDMLM